MGVVEGGRARRLVALLVALAIWSPARAIRFDWTADEIECAQTVGVDLAGNPDPGPSNYVKRLAWLADLVVYGTVSRIDHDAKSGYHTRLRIKVLSVRKGDLPKGPLTVALISGPIAVSYTDEILQAEKAPEPTFASGESVLLFLTNGPGLFADDAKYELPANAYRLVNDAKLLIDGTTMTLSGWGQGQYNVVQSDYQIRRVVDAQATNCR